VVVSNCANAMELMMGLTEYFVFYNGERPHQSLGNLTPDKVKTFFSTPSKTQTTKQKILTSLVS
jgi:hypothetical protein